MVRGRNVGEDKQLHSAERTIGGAARFQSIPWTQSWRGTGIREWWGVRFSIVTPCLRQLDWLDLAARSVADQGVETQHIVQDGGSGPDFENWARKHPGVEAYSEPDSGMYDALNRGFSRAKGEIWAWLNCDEQYLPGALQAVAAEFAARPELDVLLADNLVVTPDGEYLAHRFSLEPTPAQMWVRFPVASCALFFRPRVWQPFDPRWKSSGDWWWFREILKHGARIGVIRKFVAAFSETQANLGLASVTAGEQAHIFAARPWWARVGKPFLLTVHRWRMWRAGAYHVAPFRYAIYTDDRVVRKEFAVDRPTARWRR